MKKSSSSRSLKRPGSPNLSDASGTDASTRKKKLKSKHLPSTQPTPSHSRPMSPANVGLPSASAPLQGQSVAALKHRKRGGVGRAGSDTESVLSDGAAMSDGSRSTARRLKLKMSVSPPATQPPSRAASPGPARSAPSPGGPGSPNATVQFPSVQDIKSAIPVSGITIKDLMKVVAHPKERRADFVSLVKEVARMDKERGVLVLK
jgi:transcription initiation factor TFIIF subunit alpha